MRGTMRKIVNSIVVTSLAAALASCINADPSNFYVDAGADIARPDIVVDDSGDAPDPNAACKACLEAPEDPGPGCKGPVDACKADEMCAKIYDCGFENACWGLAAIPEIQICGYMKCIVPLGLGLSDPSVALATAVVVCTIPKCNPNPCGPTL